MNRGWRGHAPCQRGVEGPAGLGHTLRSRCVKAIRRFTIHPVLPEPLEPLRSLLLNLRWSWDANTRALFAAIDPDSRELAEQDPGALLGQLPQGRLTKLAADDEFLGWLSETTDDLRDYLTGPRWYQSAAGAAAVGDRVLLARVRHHRGAAAVLRRARHPGRRPSEGGQRPRRAADRRRPAVPARLLHPVAVDRGLAGRALSGLRPERAAALAAARRQRLARPGERRARGRRHADRAGLDRRGRPGAAAAARLVRGGERPRPARGDRPAVRRRHRSPAAAGAAARRRRRARRPGLLRADRPPLARGVPHQRGARRASWAWSGSASTSSRA